MKHASRIRFIEFAGLSGTGKTTIADRLVRQLGPDHPIGRRVRFSAPLRRPAYIALMLREALRWLALYRVLRRTLPGRTARRRLRMYIKHLWRRRQQVRAGTSALVIEDEAFATWFARDLMRCPDFAGWLAANVDLFYPRRLGRRDVEYVLVTLACSELQRTQRVHRRRLALGPRYAREEFERDGTFASRRPALVQVNELLQTRHLVTLVDGPDKGLRLARDPLAAQVTRRTE